MEDESEVEKSQEMADTPPAVRGSASRTGSSRALDYAGAFGLLVCIALSRLERRGVEQGRAG